MFGNIKNLNRICNVHNGMINFFNSLPLTFKFMKKFKLSVEKKKFLSTFYSKNSFATFKK